MSSVDLLDSSLVTVEAAARLLGISRSKLYLLMAKGQVPHVKFGAGRRASRRVPRAALNEYVRANLVDPAGVLVVTREREG